MQKFEWVLCPNCGNKTRTMIRENTELRNFPLYCPKCKKETLINAKDLHITVIKESNQIRIKFKNVFKTADTIM